MNIDSSQSVVAVIVGIIIVILSVHLLYHLFVENANISRQLKALCFLFAATYIPLTIANLFSFAVDATHRWIYNLFFNIFYNIINVLLYLIIIWRYHQTFKLSQYCASNQLRLFIVLLIFVYFLTYSAWIVVYALYYRNSVTFPLFLVLFITESILLLIDVLLTLVITYLFCRNLILLAVQLDFTNSPALKSPTTKSRTRKRKAIELMETSTETSTVTANTSLLLSSASTDSSASPSVFAEDEQLNTKQQRLLNVCVRLLVLTVPAMLSTSAVWFVSLIAWTLIYYQHEYARPLQLVLHVLLIPIDCVSNFLCVYLAFDFVARHYRFFCCCVHKCCYQMFKRSIVNKVNAV